MWAELLPKMVGGILTDHDAPDEPTPIVGYELTTTYVGIEGEAFTFGANREYIGITADGPGRLRIHTTFGMGATVEMPAQREG